VGGKHWAVLQYRSDCGTAQALIKGLADAKVPQGQAYNLQKLHLSAYAGWRCLGTSPPGTKASLIACGKGRMSRSPWIFVTAVPV
jgi:hypothetical protein